MLRPPTIATAHDLNSKVDAILKVVWKQADKLSRHHPVQSALSHPLIIMVTKKNLEKNSLGHLKT